jgi:two-component sensor histidine kinase
MIDIQGTIRLANDRFMEYIQNEDNIINHNIMAFFTDDSALELKKKIAHIVATDFHETIIMQAKMVTCRKISKRTISYIKMLPGNQQILISIADITQLKNYEDKLNRSLQEKNILLKEIHHRVKNNLQLVSSFIRIYLNSLDHFDKEKIIKEINSKINTVGIVHERLYKSDSYKDISTKKYIEKLVPELLSTYRDRKIRIKYDLEDIYINLNKSIPLGLILSEVITNSIKYAFPENYTGNPEIGISLRKSDKFYHFNIYDNGVGLDSDEKSFGHELIAILTQQLNGNSRFHNDHGVIFELEIPCKY